MKMFTHCGVGGTGESPGKVPGFIPFDFGTKAMFYIVLKAALNGRGNKSDPLNKNQKLRNEPEDVAVWWWNHGEELP